MKPQNIASSVLAAAVLLITASAFAQTEVVTPVPVEQSKQVNLYGESFFVPSAQKLDQKVTEVRGFSVIKTHSRSQNAEYSVITDFAGGAVKARYLPGPKDIQGVDEYIKKNLQTATFQGVEIRKLPIPVQGGTTVNLYWVGDRSFSDPKSAAGEITRVKALIESQGGNFAESVRAMPVFVEPEQPVEPVKTRAQFQKEEELVLKFTDQMSIGEKFWGPFHGIPSGEPVLWQSFGSTSWRKTDLAERNFNTQVGYWTNRVVVKGIRAPLNTIDPYVESTINLTSGPTPWASTFELWAGLEWRPLERNVWLQNFRPFGNIPILEWMRNYRFYIQYGNNYNIKEQFTAENYDLVWGLAIFYEWGIDLPPLDEPKPVKFSDYLRQYVWGEYYGNYSVFKTEFSSQKSFNAFIANSSVMLGLHLPGIPLPHNPINDQLSLMPYLHFEHINNAEYSFWYENQMFLGVGIRWMPFREYRWKENEWLSKTKVYGEWIGIGRAQRYKQDGSPNVPNYDLRFGVQFSSRRF